MYTLEFSAEELNMLYEALESWERESTGGAMTAGLLGMMLSRDKDEAEKSFHETMDNGKREADIRKRKAIILKARLMEALDDHALNSLFRRSVSTDAP